MNAPGLPMTNEWPPTITSGLMRASSSAPWMYPSSRIALLRETMAALEDKLDPEQFLRIHRSTMVNLERIRDLEPYFHGDYVLRLADGTRLTLSRTYRERLQQRLGRSL